MDISLTQGGTTLTFPVLPSSYQVSEGQNNTTVTINAIGEVNLLGKETLTTVSFSSFFPHDWEYGATMSPAEYVETLRRMKRNGPATLHLLDVLAMHCTIENFEWSEEDATGDIYFNLSLKKYIYIDATGIVATKLEEAARATPDTPRNGKTYTVKAGDNLFTIARRQLGNADWEKIYEANKEVIGSNPNRIKPGMRLTLPEV